MKRSGMLTVISLTAACLAMVIVQPVFARPTSELKIMIFPLECSIDLLHIGVTAFRQITPENCQDPDEEPGIPGDTGQSPTPMPAQQPQKPGNVWYGNVTSPLQPIPITTLPDSPEVRETVVVGRPHDHKVSDAMSAGQMQIMTIIILLPLLALLYALTHLFLGKIGRR